MTDNIQMSEKEINQAIKVLLSYDVNGTRYSKNDNYGKPKTQYLRKLVLMTDVELREECKDKIWLSSYAANNARSDYHWQCDACYDECKRRNKDNTYVAAYKSVSSQI